MATSFGVDAERYDRARPPYPAELIERVRSASPGPDVLDVGCGTGVEGRQLRDSGCAVLGIEPDERMAQVARRHGLQVEVSTFEAWTPWERTFDAVVAGTAWHWIDPVAGAAKAAGLLRSGGLLAPFWHVTTAPEPVHVALAEAVARVAPDAPVSARAERQGLTGYSAILERTADGIRRAGRFAEPQQWVYHWRRNYRRAEWLDHLATTGILTRLPAPDRHDVLSAVAAVIDAGGGRITVEYSSVVVAARKDG
jgi:SAM-dependent methyltransferase